MQPNPEAVQPKLEILDGVVPDAVHQAAWVRCNAKNWYFGNASNNADFGRFWKMDLDGDEAFHAVWEAVRPRCEARAGTPLRVIRQYANGHTYGLGGSPHVDDTRPGTFTLLYYPHLEWLDQWDGETMYYDARGEIQFAVRPRPNRAVFFDSRIPHAGRAPSRLCPALRVTVAFKLESVSTVAVSGTAQGGAEEIGREGLASVFRLRIPASQVDAAVEHELTRLAKSVRLPAFRAGEIPRSVLFERYGARTRVEVLNRLGAEAANRALADRYSPSEIILESGAQSGDLQFLLKATNLSELPDLDPALLRFERLTAEAAEMKDVLAADLQMKVLDRLHEMYPLKVVPKLVELELASLRQAAQADGIDIPENELRALAERRVSLGIVLTELAKRMGISGSSADLERSVIAHILSHAQITERPATREELREIEGA